jgi:hypothetical protein
MRVQLLTFPGCPNAAATREVLRRALADADAPAGFDEVDTSAPGVPDGLASWPSPTILIEGLEIEGRERPAAIGCRLYSDSEGRLVGVPPRALVFGAITRALARR